MCGFYLIVARLGDATSAFRPACLVQAHAFALHDDSGTCPPLLMSLWLGSVLSARVDYLRLIVSLGRNAPPHCDGWRKRWDSNPRYALTHGGFQDRCLKPLGHPSSSVPSVDSLAPFPPSRLSGQAHPQPAGEILNELPGHAPASPATGDAPFHCGGAQLFLANGQGIGSGIAFDHCKKDVLA